MFSKIIENTLFTTDAANIMFPNIYGDSYNRDNSFLSVMRAVLSHRMRDDESIRLRVTESWYDDSRFSGSIKDLLGHFYCDLHPETIYICGVSGSKDGVSAVLDLLDAEFIKQNSGYEQNLQIQKFFESKTIKVRFYINSEAHSSVAFVENLNVRIWHCIACFLKILTPWWFQGEFDSTAEEKELFKSLTLKNVESTEKQRGFNEMIAVFAKKFDFRSYEITAKLKGFNKAIFASRLANLQADIDRKRRQMEEALEQYSVIYQLYEESNMLALGIKTQMESQGENDELLEFCLSNKNIELRSVRSPRIDIVVKGVMTNWNEAIVEDYLKRDNTVLFRGYEIDNVLFGDMDNRRKLLTALFSRKPKLELKVCANYSLQPNGMDSSRYYNFGEAYQDYLPNPHIYHYACMGDFPKQANPALRDGDYVMAIAMCQQSAQSFTIIDGAVMPKFMQDLFNSKHKIILLPDGTSVTPADALKWLDENEPQ